MPLVSFRVDKVLIEAEKTFRSLVRFITSRSYDVFDYKETLFDDDCEQFYGRLKSMKSRMTRRIEEQFQGVWTNPQVS